MMVVFEEIMWRIKYGDRRIILNIYIIVYIIFRILLCNEKLCYVFIYIRGYCVCIVVVVDLKCRYFIFLYVRI